jgi:hypothetical protein
VQEFLESHPVLLPGGDGDAGPGGHHGPHLDGVFREVPLKGLNRDQRPDFMWITRSTSLLTPICIEIEKPDRAWFTSKGDPTAELTHARSQINKWRDWFSQPPNQMIFREQYVGNEYSNKQLLPIYILIYGRAREFDPSARIHLDADDLRRQRDQGNKSDELSMTFDSLKPRYALKDFVTLSMNKHGVELHAVPPSFTTGPCTMHVAKVARDPSPIKKTLLWTPERKQYVQDRWRHWQQIADNGWNGPVALDGGE